MSKVQGGTVYLVGAGPGDAGLITRRGWEILRACDVVVYDRLVGAELLDEIRVDAEKIFVGKQAANHAMAQEEINELLVQRAREGKSVCRLKGGDPFVFGRGGEEALHCRANNVPFEIVPGVTSSIAAPAYAGIPVTQRADENFVGATSFAVVTGHTKDDDAPPQNLPIADTLVFLMGVRALPKIVRALLEQGRDASTPVALVRWGTTQNQQVVTGTLQTIESEVERAKLKPPALIVVGEVVKLREKLQWFDDVRQKPLWGKTVVVTRAREQASSLVTELQNRGARVLQCPTIKVEPLQENQLLTQLNRAINVMLHEGYDWVIFTSSNGVDYFWKHLREGEYKADARAFMSTRIAAIGPTTAKALENRGLFADFVPKSSISEKVAEGLIELGVNGKSILLVRALEGREVLIEKLEAAGAIVTLAPCYKTVADHSDADLVRREMENGNVHWVTFTSSSTVKNFADALGKEVFLSTQKSFRVACIGPITAQTAREFGCEPDVVAETADVESLARALAEFLL